MDIDAMFTDLLGEMDNLSQSLTSTVDEQEEEPESQERKFSVGFTHLNGSVNDLEDHDLDALMDDLESKLKTQEPSTNADISSPSDDAISPPVSEPVVTFSTPTEPTKVVIRTEPQTKAEKIQLALEKLKEAKVKKLIVKIFLADQSCKTLLVDERQTVREVLDKLFEKTHCDVSVDWSLCETNPELEIERSFEDHECLVDSLSVWTRQSQNKLYFVSKAQKYLMFTEPQLFYMWKKKTEVSNINSQVRESLIKEHFGGSAVIVPDIEGKLYVKEDGKKLWRPRFFVLRASGIYFVPKRKTKSSTDLVCFARLEKLNIYTTSSYRQKYRAPSDFCFILKHPCIQRESPHIRFMCCENEHTLLLWVGSIRIAKYGMQLYKNYQEALERKTLQSTADNDVSSDHISLDGSGLTKIDDFPDEPPPDFIPPPPPGQEHV